MAESNVEKIEDIDDVEGRREEVLATTKEQLEEGEE